MSEQDQKQHREEAPPFSPLVADIRSQRCPNCAPGYDCERGIYAPTKAAEARTALPARVDTALTTLRAYLEDLDDRFLEHESSVVFESLGVVEQYVRGGDR